MNMTSKQTAFLGLGSNLGDRENFIREAMRRLHVPGVCEVRRASAIYETKPWGRSDVPSYLNCVVEVATDLIPRALMIHGHLVERRLGRMSSGEKWAPRNIDIDVLLYGDRQVVNNPSCMIPHPMLHLRAFALKPLRELDTNLVHPVLDRSVDELWDSLPEEDRFAVVEHISIDVEEILSSKRPFVDTAPAELFSNDGPQKRWNTSDSNPGYNK